MLKAIQNQNNYYFIFSYFLNFILNSYLFINEKETISILLLGVKTCEKIQHEYGSATS